MKSIKFSCSTTEAIFLPKSQSSTFDMLQSLRLERETKVTEENVISKALKKELLAAVCSNDTDKAQRLLEQGVDPNGTVTPNETLLLRAVWNLNSCLVESLLAHGAKLKTNLQLLAIVHKPDFPNTSCINRAYGDADRLRLAQKLERYRAQLDSNSPLSISRFDQAALALQDFDIEKQQCFDKITHYTQMLKFLLDCSVGQDVSLEDDEFCGNHTPPQKIIMPWLKNIDIAGFSFVGLSFQGIPITKNLLISLKLNGAREAMVSTEDLNCYVDIDSKRRFAILKRLHSCIERRGILDKDGIHNVIPLVIAAKIGDEHALRSRLEAGVDPNEDDIHEGKSPLYWAIKNGHSQIVRILCEHPSLDPNLIISAHAFLNRYDEVDFECLKRVDSQEYQAKMPVTNHLVTMESKESEEARREREAIEQIWGLNSCPLEKLDENDRKAQISPRIGPLATFGFYSHEASEISEDELHEPPGAKFDFCRQLLKKQNASSDPESSLSIKKIE